MKRMLAVLAIAVAGVVPAAAAAELEYALSQPLLDFIAATPESRSLAVGEGKLQVAAGEREQVTFAGHGTPFDARGSVTYHVSGAAFQASEHGKVDCVNVVDDRHAALSGRFDEALVLGGQPAGEYFLVLVEDNGEPSATNAEPDRARLILSTSPEDCTNSPALGFATLPVMQGNVVVINRQ